MRDENCTPLWREAHFEVKNVQNTPGPDHFWQLRCRKSARRFGAKHISKSKCTKHTTFGPLLAVEMSKKCTPFWREAHIEVKMYKAHHVRTTFGGSDGVSRGRRKGLCTSSEVSTTGGFVAFSTTTTTTPHHTPIHYTTTTATTTPSLHSTTLHSTTPTTLHYTPLHPITFLCTTFPYTPLHYITLQYLPLHYTTLHYTTLHYTTLHYITLN